MPTPDRPEPTTQDALLSGERTARLVTAARNGDRAALDRLLAESMPLVYTIVGRALGGHADVDDVVQDIMVRAVPGLSTLREPASFRSWLVAITMRQLRNHHRSQRSVVVGAGSPDDVADPGADFVELTIARLGLSGQRREVVEATRWLEPDDRELLSLWWLETAGQLSRTDVAQAMQLTPAHAAVRVQRMKEQLDAARAIIRALTTSPRCPQLAGLTTSWDGHPVPVWRKRLARHVIDCPHCRQSRADHVALPHLLAGIPLTPVPYALAQRIGADTGSTLVTSTGRHIATRSAGRPARGLRRLLATHGSVAKPVLAGLTALIVIGAGSAAVLWSRADDASNVAAANPPAVSASPSATPPATTPAPTTPVPTTPPARSSTTKPAAPPPPPADRPSSKKGVSAWYFAGFTQALADVKASWYYNWAASRDNLTAPPGVEYVPMIWGKDSVKQSTLDQARSQGKVLLGFNEPDLAGQANMTVAQALDLWPQLESTGLRLGSPAPAYGADTPGGWFDQFMSGAAQRGYRVDFIALHWYGSDFSAAATNQLKGYLQATYNRYHKPIWLTEYALMNFSGATKYPTQEQQAAFVTASTQMMESLSYVERYAWFALPATEGSGTGLYKDATTPTTVGAAYRAAG